MCTEFLDSIVFWMVWVPDTDKQSQVKERNQRPPALIGIWYWNCGQSVIPIFTDICVFVYVCPNQTYNFKDLKLGTRLRVAHIVITAYPEKPTKIILSGWSQRVFVIRIIFFFSFFIVDIFGEFVYFIFDKTNSHLTFSRL